MSAPQPLRMSYEEWVAWPYEGKSEWVDGTVVVSPSPSFDHGGAEWRVCAAISLQVPALKSSVEADLKLPRNRVRRPDVLVLDHRTDQFPITEVPILVAEVLSPSNRSEDTVRKAGEYADFGVGHYWLIDPEARVIDVFENVGGGWEPLLKLTEQQPLGSVTIGSYGTVELDLRAILDLPQE